MIKGKKCKYKILKKKVYLEKNIIKKKKDKV